MAGYRYGGTDFDANRTLAPPKPRKPKASVAECGTLGGVSKHRRHGEEICTACADANRAYKKEWRERVNASRGITPRAPKAPKVPKETRPRRNAAECGTNSGYTAHTTRKEPICQPCREAHHAYTREYRARKRAA